MKTTCCVTLLFLLFAAFGAAGQGNPRPVQTPADSAAQKKTRVINLDSLILDQELEIDQLIFNETLSKAGNDFYQILYSLWTWPPDLKGSFTIVVSERPAMGRLTVLEVSVNDIRVFENFTQPRYDALEEMAQNAVGMLMDAIVNYQSIVKDLAGKDLLGSGIY